MIETKAGKPLRDLLGFSCSGPLQNQVMIQLDWKVEYPLRVGLYLYLHRLLDLVEVYYALEP